MKDPKRILMIAATPFFSDRGCHIRIFNEIKYLNKNEIDVELCTYHLGSNPQGLNPLKIYRTINIPWYKKLTPGASPHKLYIDIFLLFISIKRYFKFKPNIVYAHLYEALVAGIIIKFLTFGKAKVYFDCQGSLGQEMYAYTLHKKKFYKYFLPVFFGIEKLLLKFPDKIFCSSVNSYNFLIEKYGINRGNINLLEDGLDPELFESISADEKKKDKN